MARNLPGRYPVMRRGGGKHVRPGSGFSGSSPAFRAPGPFDYRLRQGVVRNSNALALMRAVGLEV
jgi:hypothetical protein